MPKSKKLPQISFEAVPTWPSCPLNRHYFLHIKACFKRFWSWPNWVGFEFRATSRRRPKHLHFLGVEFTKYSYFIWTEPVLKSVLWVLTEGPSCEKVRIRALAAALALRKKSIRKCCFKRKITIKGFKQFLGNFH